MYVWLNGCACGYVDEYVVWLDVCVYVCKNGSKKTQNNEMTTFCSDKFKQAYYLQQNLIVNDWICMVTRSQLIRCNNRDLVLLWIYRIVQTPSTA